MTHVAAAAAVAAIQLGAAVPDGATYVDARTRLPDQALWELAVLMPTSTNDRFIARRKAGWSAAAA